MAFPSLQLRVSACPILRKEGAMLANCVFPGQPCAFAGMTNLGDPSSSNQALDPKSRCNNLPDFRRQFIRRRSRVKQHAAARLSLRERVKPVPKARMETGIELLEARLVPAA